MSDRKNFLIRYGIFYVVLVIIIYFGIKYYYQKNFSIDKLNQMISGKSKYSTLTDDLCKFQILGDPKEVDNYIKINIYCNQEREARSTISLSAIKIKTFSGVLEEYANVVNIKSDFYKGPDISCDIDGLNISEENINQIIIPKSTINCRQYL